MTTPYTYSPGIDGCDETFDIYDPTGEHMVSVHFWEEREWVESTARLIVHRLNRHELLVEALKRAEFLMRRVSEGDHKALQNLHSAAEQAQTAIAEAEGTLAA